MGLNACESLRELGFCTTCIVSDGQDQPSIVTVNGTTDAPPMGTCLWTANLVEPPRCNVTHPWTSRVCACRPRVALADASNVTRMSLLLVPSPEEAMLETSSMAGLKIPQVLEPRARVSKGLGDRQCGSAYGNRLSTLCAAKGHWCCSADMECGDTREHCGGAECPHG